MGGFLGQLYSKYKAATGGCTKVLAMTALKRFFLCAGQCSAKGGSFARPGAQRWSRFKNKPNWLGKIKFTAIFSKGRGRYLYPRWAVLGEGRVFDARLNQAEIIQGLHPF